MLQVFFTQKTALTGVHKAPPFCPSHSMVHKPLITALWKRRQGNHKFKVTLDYMESSRPAWGTQAPNSKEKRESAAQSRHLLLSCKRKPPEVLTAKAMKQTKTGTVRYLDGKTSVLGLSGLSGFTFQLVLKANPAIPSPNCD